MTYIGSLLTYTGTAPGAFLAPGILMKKQAHVLRRAPMTIPGGLCNSNPVSFQLISTYRPTFFKDQIPKLGVFFTLTRRKKLQSWHFFKHIYIQLETRHLVTD